MVRVGGAGSSAMLISAAQVGFGGSLPSQALSTLSVPVFAAQVPVFGYQANLSLGVGQAVGNVPVGVAHIMGGTNVAYAAVVSGVSARAGTTKESDYTFGLNWLTTAIDAGRHNCGKTVLAAFITGLSNLLSQRQYASVDAILRSLRPGDLSPQVLLAAVRTSFPARHKLTAWRMTVLQMRDEFVARGLDPTALMSGLL